ncbi:MAG: MFS transporter [Patescibacteria group bacterium]
MSRRVIETKAIFYTLSFLSMYGMGFVGATYATFLTSYGLDRLAMNIVNVFFMITLFMGELPTGAIADVFGRKTACVLAFSIRATGMVIYGFSHSFWAFVLAEVIAGIGLTFENGALQAWAVDRLKHSGGHDAIDVIYQRKAQMKLLGAMAGGICGSLVSMHGLSLPWFWGAGILYCTSILVFVVMKEEYFEPKKYSWTDGFKAFRNTIVEGLHFGLKSPVIQFLFIANAVFLFATQAPNMFWQLYFKPAIHAQYQYGFIHFTALAAMFAGSTYAFRIAKWIGCEQRAILVSFVFTGIWLGLAGLIPLIGISLPAFILHELGRGLFDPIKDKYLNANIPSEKRATLDSLQSTTRHIGSITGLLVSGIIATTMSDGASWMISGIVLIVGGLAVYVRIRVRETNGTS